MKNKLNLGAVAIGVAMTASAIMASAVQAENSAQGASEHRWVVDAQGRPPFKRERVAVTEVDMASMETVGNVTGTETVRVREYRGRPPFARRTVEVPVVDMAAMELDSDTGPSTDFRGRPPFKRHR